MSGGGAQTLAIASLSAGYNGADIVHGASFVAQAGRITLVAGPNGAGKSTLMKVIAGTLPAHAGHVLVGERDVARLGPADRARAGLAYVPQERNIFGNLSIGENLSIGFEFVHSGAGRPAFIAARDQVLALFPDLAPRLHHRAGVLSGGQRQMLAIASALIAGPSVLLLDEPSAGLSPKVVSTLLAAVRAVNCTGVTVLMIEQNVAEATRVSDVAILLVGGEVRGEWAAHEFMTDPTVRTLFLHGAPSAGRLATAPEAHHAASPA